MIDPFVFSFFAGAVISASVLFLFAHFSESDDEKDSMGCDELLLDPEGSSHAKSTKYDIEFIDGVIAPYYRVDGRSYIAESLSKAIEKHEDHISGIEKRKKEVDDYRSVFEEAAKSQFFQDDGLRSNKGETLNVKFYKVGEEEIREDEVVSKIESLNSKIARYEKQLQPIWDKEKKKRQKRFDKAVKAELATVPEFAKDGVDINMHGVNYSVVAVENVSIDETREADGKFLTSYWGFNYIHIDRGIPCLVVLKVIKHADSRGCCEETVILSEDFKFVREGKCS